MSHAALFLRFLRFGLLAFGGPVAQIAMIRRALVEEERWIGSDAFNRLLAVMQILPGPEAHELCVHLGIRAKGRLGGVLAGLGFMTPGFLLMLGLAWLYAAVLADLTAFQTLFLGAQAAVLAVILKALHGIGRHILTDGRLWAVFLGATAASLAGASFWIVLPVAGLAYVLAREGRSGQLALLLLAGVAATVVLALYAPAEKAAVEVTAAQPAGTVVTFLAGLKAGLLTFGGAYAAIPFVRDDSVGRGWMSDAEFLDGVALAGLIPAPLIIFGTFVGWIAGGLAGALAMTAGIFLPAFAFSLLFYERIEAVADHLRLRHFLAGVAAAVIGLISVTLIELVREAVARSPDLPSSALAFALALLVVVRWRHPLSVPLALAGGALVGSLALG